MQRMAWKDIREHYPNQWVGLKDVEWDAKHCPITAEVVYTDKSLKEMISELLNKDTLIMPVHTDPEKYVDTLTGESLSWKDIKEKYPDQWVGLKDVQYVANSLDVKNATVVLVGLSMDELTVIQFGTCGNVYAACTAVDDDLFVGVLQ